MDPSIVMRNPTELRPYQRNARKHSKKQIRQIADSIQRFGFTNPILVHFGGDIVAGHGRCAAALLLALPRVPTIEISHLSDAEVRALILADNKLALNAGWDQELLALEFQGLLDVGFDLQVTGFSSAEIDLTLDFVAEASTSKSDAADDQPVELPTSAVTRRGDVWNMGRHRLICDDAQNKETYDALLGAEKVDLIFTDPPYNVKIDGNAVGLGRNRHREFEFASGEMSKEQFTSFLDCTLGNMAERCRPAAIAFVCMDWRHQLELLVAGQRVFKELKNLCVWNKTNGGMGTFYRSKHELIFVFKVGVGEHTNTFGLGDKGRYRTNVWDYAGVNTFSSTRSDDLAMHPTVKPVALVADAIRDCSVRGNIVLDAFGGSGTTLIAAERTGRTARLVELDSRYCDTIIKRYERLTGKCATLAGIGTSFEEVAESREDQWAL